MKASTPGGSPPFYLQAAFIFFATKMLAQNKTLCGRRRSLNLQILHLSANPASGFIISFSTNVYKVKLAGYAVPPVNDFILSCRM